MFVLCSSMLLVQVTGCLSSVLLDNGYALNVCPLVTANCFGIFGHPHRPSELMKGLIGQLWVLSLHLS